MSVFKRIVKTLSIMFCIALGFAVCVAIAFGVVQLELFLFDLFGKDKGYIIPVNLLSGFLTLVFMEIYKQV